MMFSPGTPDLEAPSPGQFVGMASACLPTILSSATSSSRLAVRRMPTMPSITCGRSYGAIITFCYQIISKIGPRACRQSRTRTSDRNFFASSRSLREIIYQDVLRTSGQFYLKYQPSNSEIETTLQMQADNDRTFMTTTKDGGDNPQVQGIIVAISKGGSDKYGVSNPQGAKGKINILSSPICH